MTMQRDLLEAPSVVGSSNAELLRLMAQQNDFLQNIAFEIRKQNPDVLCTAVVKGTGQNKNQNVIVDTRSHEVFFEVGGKPVEIYHLIAFSTYSTEVAFSIQSMSSFHDGIPLSAGDVYDLSVAVKSVYVMSPSSTDSTTPCPVNGPAENGESLVGGIFLYGFTIPDYDRVRNAIRL